MICILYLFIHTTDLYLACLGNHKNDIFEIMNLTNNKQILTYFEWTWSNVDLLEMLKVIIEQLVNIIFIFT